MLFVLTDENIGEQNADCIGYRSTSNCM